MKLIEFLQGKKTYFAAGIGILYAIGAWLGFWDLTEEIITICGLGGLAFLRAGQKKSEERVAEKIEKKDLAAWSRRPS